MLDEEVRGLGSEWEVGCWVVGVLDWTGMDWGRRLD